MEKAKKVMLAHATFEEEKQAWVRQHQFGSRILLLRYT